MANTEIDSLSLEIKIEGLNSEDIKNLDKLSKAVSRLTKSLKEANFSKLKDIQVPKGLKNIQIITQNFKGMSSTPVANEVGEIETSVEDLGETVSETTTEVDDDLLKIQQGASDVLPNVRREIRLTKKELGGFSFKNFSENLSKMFKRFKTILFIKAVRAILNAVVQAIQAGIKNLASFDSDFNDTMSKIKTSTTMMSNSLAMIFRPIIELIQPLLTFVSQILALIANEVSKIQAIMKGSNKYTKINADYMEDYANASKKASLFNFDTFNTLKDNEENSMFETEDLGFGDEQLNKFDAITKALNSIVKLISSIFKALSPVLEAISIILSELLEIVDEILNPIFIILDDLITPVVSGIIKMISDILKPVLLAIKTILEPIQKVINIISLAVSKIIELLMPTLLKMIENVGNLLEPVSGAIEYILNMIGAVLDIFSDILHLDFEGLGEKIVRYFKNLFFGLVKILASVLDAIVNNIIEGINFIFTPLNAISDFFDWGWNIGIEWRMKLADKVPSFANGGIVGELWQMNEYGNAEMLYNANNSGNTSVINQAQLSLAFEQAIYNTGLLDAIEKAGIIEIDGRDIAQSNNFKRELNRTNPSLKLR